MSGHRLTLRQQWVLLYLRTDPGATLARISENSPINRPKTAALRERHRTLADVKVRSIEYPTAQQAVRRLLDLGLVRREPEDRRSTDPPYRHFLTGKTMPTDDPLERDFAAPTF